MTDSQTPTPPTESEVEEPVTTPATSPLETGSAVEVESSVTIESTQGPIEARPTSTNDPDKLGGGYPAKRDISTRWSYLGLVIVLIIGAYFRFTGLNWDDGQYLHPDERFMTSVASSITPGNPLQYFDTANSTLNPFPYGSYTYGMFPLFLTRFVGQALNQADYGKIGLVGRALSGLFDLGATLGLFFLGVRFYSRKVGLLAAALYSACVLPIQLSHYFTVDSFATVFIVAAFFIADSIMEKGQRWQYAVFGILTGLAMASKINTAPVAGIVVVAGTVRLAKGYYDKEDRSALLKEVLIGWGIAGILAAISFRILQPYAFTGPSILGVGFNPRWLDIMKEVTDQVAGHADYPPNMHWADRSQLTFAWIQNAVWGVGVPLGLVATIAWVWAAIRAFQTASLDKASSKTWQSHLLLVLWVGGYFAWQNAQFWRYMRYFMPIYPFAVLLASWALLEFYDWVTSRGVQTIRQLRQTRLLKAMSVISLVTVLMVTYGYAFAFTRIYTRPHTRVAASLWMLNNIPGPLNAQIDTADGIESQPIEVPYDLILKEDAPWHRSFDVKIAGTLSGFTAFHLYAPDTVIHIKLSHQENGDEQIIEGEVTVPATPTGVPSVTVPFESRTLGGGQTYYVQYTVKSGGALKAMDLSLSNDKETILDLGQDIETPNTDPISGTIAFTPDKDITVDQLRIGTFQVTYPAETSTVKLTLSRDDAGQDKIAESTVNINLAEAATPQEFKFATVDVQKDQNLFVSLAVVSGAPVHPAGSTLVMETSWDDTLPLRTQGYDPLGGIYRTTNMEMFGNDTVAKRDNIIDALNRSDYIVVSSNRSYDAMPRLPLRYPLAVAFYEALFDCNKQRIIECAYPAQDGLQGPLGYQLVQTFESDPNIGPFSFSDQWAEEAFTVYDHPKVMLFKKTADYSPEAVSQLLDSVDLSQILEQDAASYTAMPTGLVLPADRAQAQLQNGTWSSIFDPNSLLNTNETAGVIAWYLLILLISLVSWPLVFLAMRGLPDRGYPLAKLIGLLLITWMAWLAGSYKVLMFTQLNLWLLIIVVSFISGIVVTRCWPDLVDFMRRHWRYLLVVEGITLALFLYFLAVRWGNPDLWHPWLGGEKPADFSFFQSALRTVYFPPYDPWLAGHYVNYYYYGYVVSAIPAKLLGIVPAFAYNLVLPSLFSFAGIGAFCVAFNLSALLEQFGLTATPTAEETAKRPDLLSFKWAMVAGVSAAIMLVLLGNLYQIRQFWQYLPEVADPPSSYSDNLFDQTQNVINGGWRFVTGQVGLPGDKGRWYFGASRAILHDKTDTPITEFPYFSFLYADLHPHLTSMSIILAALAWIVSLIFTAGAGLSNTFGTITEGAGWRALFKPEIILTWLAGGLIVGALQPTQTWDYPVLLVLGVVAIGTAICLQYRTFSRQLLLQILIYTAGFAILSIGFYEPFRQWFATQFTTIDIWQGLRTPLIDYLSVHGLFLFIIISILIWESRFVLKLVPFEFLLNTPLGELIPKIKNQLILAAVGVVGFIVISFVLLANDYQSVWFAGLLLIWVTALILRPSQAMPQRVWLTLVGAGLGVTIVVELVTLRGDLGRSNTVFKYYIEAWVFFSVTAAVALAWLLPNILREWSLRLRRVWLSGLGLLVAAAATYTLTATYAKVTDRWPEISNPPHTLIGNAYMLGDAPTAGTNPQPAFYDDDGTRYNLTYDYEAIQWLQRNVQGTPVIVEGNSPLYRWGSRIAINTGLPNIVGWDNHLKQHDSILPPVYIDNRLKDVSKFYNTTDPQIALDLARQYQARFIIVGALERKYYEADGLAKFSTMVQDGLLSQVFPLQTPDQPDQATYIYEIPETSANGAQ